MNHPSLVPPFQSSEFAAPRRTLNLRLLGWYVAWLLLAALIASLDLPLLFRIAIPLLIAPAATLWFKSRLSPRPRR